MYELVHATCVVSPLNICSNIFLFFLNLNHVKRLFSCLLFALSYPSSYPELDLFPHPTAEVMSLVTPVFKCNPWSFSHTLNWPLTQWKWSLPLWLFCRNMNLLYCFTISSLSLITSFLFSIYLWKWKDVATYIQSSRRSQKQHKWYVLIHSYPMYLFWTDVSQSISLIPSYWNCLLPGFAISTDRYMNKDWLKNLKKTKSKIINSRRNYYNLLTKVTQKR